MWGAGKSFNWLSSVQVKKVGWNYRPPQKKIHKKKHKINKKPQSIQAQGENIWWTLFVIAINFKKNTDNI